MVVEGGMVENRQWVAVVVWHWPTPSSQLVAVGYWWWCGFGPLPVGSGLQFGFGGGDWLVGDWGRFLPVGWVDWV